MVALCDNGHELQSGESTCSNCGGRIRMQWMRTSATSGSGQPGSSPPVPRWFAGSGSDLNPMWLALGWGLLGVLAIVNFLVTEDRFTKYSSGVQIVLAVFLAVRYVSLSRRKTSKPQ